jgi:hypothetical protein
VAAVAEPLLLTVDLEWYYNGNWTGSTSDFPSRSLQDRLNYDNGKIEDSVRFILEVLSKYERRITFFAVGELDDAMPSLLAEIRDAGHEIGLHSYRHDDLLTVDELERDLQRCSDFKQKYDVASFRAPRISVQESYYPVLHDHKYAYDSSVYGTGSFSLHGVQVVPVAALPLRNRRLRKIPCTLAQCVKSASIPFGSGIAGPIGFAGYNKFISRYTRRYSKPPCIFFHSWQLRQPHYPLRFFARHPAMYLYSVECQGLFEQLCSHYNVLPIREYFGE